MTHEEKLIAQLESKQRLVQKQVKEINKLKKMLGGEKHKTKHLEQKNDLMRDTMVELIPHVEHVLGLNHPKIINAVKVLATKNPVCKQ